MVGWWEQTPKQILLLLWYMRGMILVGTYGICWALPVHCLWILHRWSLLWAGSHFYVGVWAEGFLLGTYFCYPTWIAMNVKSMMVWWTVLGPVSYFKRGLLHTLYTVYGILWRLGYEILWCCLIAQSSSGHICVSSLVWPKGFHFWVLEGSVGRRWYLSGMWVTVMLVVGRLLDLEIWCTCVNFLS